MAQNKKDIVVGPAQSNENGTSVRFGVNSALVDNTTLSVRPVNLYGAPVLKNSGFAGMFDYLAAAVARRGYHVKLDNLAIGGTGIVGGWFGRLTNWAGTATASLGAWVLPPAPNGFKYLATVAGTTSGTAPTWPTTAGATVTDGSVTWKAFATTAKDVAGYVYMPGDDGYDPCTTIAGGPTATGARMGAVVNRIQKAKALGYEVWNIIEIGQQDIADNQSLADMTACWTVAVAQALNAGADYVLLGVTCPFLLSANIGDWGSATRPAPTAGGRVLPGVGGRIVTARANALAAYAGNPRVLPGADLSVLNDSTIMIETGVNTNLHLSHAGQQVAGKMWDDQIVSLGLV